MQTPIYIVRIKIKETALNFQLKKILNLQTARIYVEILF